MFFVFPRAIKPDVCDQIVTDCKQNILKEASVLSYDNKGRDDPTIRKTSVDFITDKDNKINELAWHFLREANKVQFHYDLTFFQAIQFADIQAQGSVICFDSRDFHRVTPVTKGIRHSVVCWTVGPNFK